MDFLFFLNAAALGVGLAMDAFSVSVANGLAEPGMARKKKIAVAGTFAFFQALMPMLGWLAVHTLLSFFTAFSRFIPWIALFLLLFIGGKMIFDGIRQKEEGKGPAGLTPATLLLQGVATSIDALSVGFTLAEYGTVQALVASVVIAGVTYLLCRLAIGLGGGIGARFSEKATVFGGAVLVLVGLEIFITGLI